MYFIIADDLTGATDTGIQFQKRGIATTVLVEPPKEALPCPGERTALSCLLYTSPSPRDSP